MKISEILHEAADVYLWDGIEDDAWCSEYSCCAVSDAVQALRVSGVCEKRIYRGLEEMGVNVTNVYQFNEFPFGEQRQAARYSWLKFAAMIAEEQGV